MPPSSIDVTKAEIRREALARRDALAAGARSAAAHAVASRPFPIRVAPGTIVAGFSPMRSEINPCPLLRQLVGLGACLVLPVVVGRGHALFFRAWTFGEPLGSGVWGTREPLPDSPEVEPDILIVPLSAFDRTGHRIGYGAGYYDLTLARLRAAKTIIAVGLAFSAQEIAAVPSTPRDERLDLVLTEHEVIDCRGA
ncbi:MAG TPA: 5-formyltetrahydrofolate cyclo-ligase [Xanthobacteraceae bacterium]|nr:5-formyltetrahydrofolate cyclo-ligase [Xanthobacteraceae bacterium]